MQSCFPQGLLTDMLKKIHIFMKLIGGVGSFVMLLVWLKLMPVIRKLMTIWRDGCIGDGVAAFVITHGVQGKYHYMSKKWCPPSASWVVSTRRSHHWWDYVSDPFSFLQSVLPGPPFWGTRLWCSNVRDSSLPPGVLWAWKPMDFSIGITIRSRNMHTHST